MVGGQDEFWRAMQYWLTPSELDVKLAWPPGWAEALVKRGKLEHAILPNGVILIPRRAVRFLLVERIAREFGIGTGGSYV